MQHESLPPKLAYEGEMMLSALLTDLLDTGINNLLCTRDPRLGTVFGQVKTIPIYENVWDIWRNCMKDSATTWIIAPETDGILFELTRMAHNAGCQVIACTPETVQITSSKIQTLDTLAMHGIPCIPVIRDFNAKSTTNTGWVVKPDDGVGASGCRYFQEVPQLLYYAQSQTKKILIQEYFSGIAASMSLLCYGGKARLLACNQQLFRFVAGLGQLDGVIVNGLPEYANQFKTLASEIAYALPGLQGYVGVDLVVADNGPLVVEINPRLTTAYAGLRQSLGSNPVEWILSIFQTGQIPEFKIKHMIPVTVSI